MLRERIPNRAVGIMPPRVIQTAKHKGSASVDKASASMEELIAQVSRT